MIAVNGNKSVAHAYAEAAFQVAKTQQQLEYWSALLNVLAIIAAQLHGKTNDPNFTVARGLELITAVAQQEIGKALDHQSTQAIPIEATRLLTLLLGKRQLSMLIDIAANFRELYLHYLGKKIARVESIQELDAMQRRTLVDALAVKFGCLIELEYVKNPELIGGVVVYVDDHVFDGSVRGWLNRIQIELAAAN